MPYYCEKCDIESFLPPFSAKILFSTSDHVAVRGEEMVEIVHIHELKGQNNYVENLDMAIEKIIKEEEWTDTARELLTNKPSIQDIFHIHHNKNPYGSGIVEECPFCKAGIPKHLSK